jgi:hypothetical protein
VDCSLGEVELSFGQPDVLDGMSSRNSDFERPAIGEPDIFTRENHHPASDESGVFTRLEHPS